MITRHQVASKLTDYLRHRLSLAQPADWATLAMMEKGFDESDVDLLSEIVSRMAWPVSKTLV